MLLDNSAIYIFAVLTDKGKELLARDGALNIKYFSVSDMDINYNLYNTNTTDDKKGILIENTPLLEPTPAINDIPYNLITLPMGTTRIPRISVGQTSITLNAGQSYIITPTVINYPNGNEILGYKATILDNTIADIIPNETINNENFVLENEIFINYANSKTVIGKSFRVIAKTLLETKQTKIIIKGNETGGTIELNLTVLQTTN